MTKPSYIEPIREYDENLVVNTDYINTLPDLQNGPSSLIQGAPVKIHMVGIHNFKLPLKYDKMDDTSIELETSVTGTVSLEAQKKGINMSRIMRTFYEYKEEYFNIDLIEKVLNSYKENIGTFEAKIYLKFSYPILQHSLRSSLTGYQYYDTTFEVSMDKSGNIKKIIHLDFVYSSACPCSYELGQHALEHRNRAVVPHSQRSVARISVEFEEMIWIEEIIDICVEKLKTETQVMVKREDEQAFAELNGTYTKFVEDAVRLLYSGLDSEKRIKDFKIICTHLESLHSHNAISVIVKGVDGGFTSDVPNEVFFSMIK